MEAGWRAKDSGVLDTYLREQQVVASETQEARLRHLRDRGEIVVIKPVPAEHVDLDVLSVSSNDDVKSKANVEARVEQTEPVEKPDEA